MENKKIIYALGFFDGVHLGHQALLKACRELAEQTGNAPGVLTFQGHPEQTLRGKAPALINTDRDKTGLLEGFSVPNVFSLPFDRALMNTHWSAFLAQLVEKDAGGFVCGSDFRFGAGGCGTAKKLEAFCKKRGLPCAIVPQQLLEGLRVSSTHIRALLEQGKMEEAGRFLGQPHILSGQVQEGKQLGRTLGFPTANIAYPAELVQLPRGVYVCKVFVDGDLYAGVTNIGTRPTVDGAEVNVETHLMNFAGDLYGKEITIAFYSFLRPEQKFSSLPELQEEIQKNITQTRNFFEKK